MDQNKIDVLDVLKVDVEHWEWPMLESSLENHVLRDRVRQLNIEVHLWPDHGTHSGRCDRLNQDCVGRVMSYYLKMFKSIEEEGFVPVDHHLNPQSTYPTVGDGAHHVRIACCYELNYINKNLFKKRTAPS